MVGGTLYQGLLVHADGRFVADLEMGGGVVCALRMARSDAAGAAGWRDLTGKLVFPAPVVLWRSGMPRAGHGGCAATTVGVPVASLSAPAPRPRHAEPFAEAASADAARAGGACGVDAVPIPHDFGSFATGEHQRERRRTASVSTVSEGALDPTSLGGVLFVGRMN